MGLIKRMISVFRRRHHIQQSLSGEIRLTGKLVAHKLPPVLIVDVSDDISVEDESFGIHRTGGGTEAIRIVDQEGTAAADLDVNGVIDYSVKGKSPQNETGSLEVCRMLIEKLNSEGASWGDPRTTQDLKPDDVDCMAHDDRNQTLKVQVTRVERDIWQTLAKHGEATIQKDVLMMANRIWEAILKKSKPVPPRQRLELVLALDATKTPGYAFEQVVETFRLKYGESASGLKFRGIWMVGPTIRLTSKLDYPS